ncbi:MAG: hypothetical protein V4649_05065 [Bacteroidota bacterium]
MKYFIAAVLLTATFAAGQARAQLPGADTVKRQRAPVERTFISSSLDGLIFSTALIDVAGNEIRGKMRFTALFNLGLSFHYNPVRFIGFFTGIDVKNIGFIMDDPAGGTAKYRTYNVGVPLGIKLGNMANNGTCLFAGGGIDLPVNYKEKHFVIRDQKTKFNEWFSSRTPATMPYVFVGVKVSKINFKAQYYPDNFLNPNFTNDNGNKPYAAYKANILYFSIGGTIHYHSKKGLVKKYSEGSHTI